MLTGFCQQRADLLCIQAALFATFWFVNRQRSPSTAFSQKLNGLLYQTRRLINLAPTIHRPPADSALEW